MINKFNFCILLHFFIHLESLSFVLTTNGEALLLLISTGEELSKESFPSDTSCSVVLKKVFVSKESLTADWLIFYLLLLLVAGVGVLH